MFTADAGEVLANDPDDPMRTAMRQVVGVFAELDRAMIAKRMRDGRKAKADAGRHAVGAYPYGFTGTGEGRDRDAGPRAEEQEALSRILELRAQLRGRPTGSSPRRSTPKACDPAGPSAGPRWRSVRSCCARMQVVLRSSGA